MIAKKIILVLLISLWVISCKPDPEIIVYNHSIFVSGIEEGGSYPNNQTIPFIARASSDTAKGILIRTYCSNGDPDQGWEDVGDAERNFEVDNWIDPYSVCYAYFGNSAMSIKFMLFDYSDNFFYSVTINFNLVDPVP